MYVWIARNTRSVTKALRDTSEYEPLPNVERLEKAHPMNGQERAAFGEAQRALILPGAR